VAYNLSFVVKNEGVLKVTGSHVHFKSGSVLKTVLDKDVETTVHKRKWYVVRPFNSSNCDDLGCMSRSFIDCKFFYTDKRVSRSLCHSRASCLHYASYAAAYRTAVFRGAAKLGPHFLAHSAFLPVVLVSNINRKYYLANQAQPSVCPEVPNSCFGTFCFRSLIVQRRRRGCYPYYSVVTAEH